MTNKWMIATIILGILVLGLIVYNVYNKQYNFNGVEISKTNFNSLSKVMGNKSKLCNLETNKCVTLMKLDE